MKNVIALVGFLLFLSGNMLAQFTFDWMQSANNNFKTSVMSAVDSEDNLVITGFWQNFETFTRKYSISGTLLWEVSDASGTSGLYEKPNWINVDSNDNILVVGNIYSYSSSTGWDYPNAIFVLKYDPAGSLLWKTVIPISITITNFNRFGMRSEIDDEGNLYIGTVINAPDGAILYKINPNGDVLFSNGSLEYFPRNFLSMRIKDNRIVLATGSSTFNVSPIFVFDNLGNLLWTQAAEGLIASDVEIDESNNIYVLSTLEDAVSGSSGFDTRITKYTSEGTLLWTQDYDFGANEISRRFTYVNNRISVIGYGNEPPNAYFDWKTFQVDTDGTLLWHAIYDATTFNDEEPYYVLAKPNGYVIVTGKGGPSPDPNNPSWIQMPIVEYDNAGNQIWMDTPNMFGGWGLATMFASDGSLYAISSSEMTVYHYFGEPLGINDSSAAIHSIFVSPNPVTSITTIALNLKESQALDITLFNVLGKSVLNLPRQELPPGESRIDLDLTGMESGFYFVQIKTNAALHSLKIIKK